MSEQPIEVVWFKRDLRVDDHVPLSRAAARGRTLCLFVIEPEWLSAQDFDPMHLHTCLQALSALDAALRERGGALVVRVGDAVEVLEAIHARHGIAHLHSHEETGAMWTYRRDQRVGRWARDRGVPWTEVPQTGVIRRLDDRDGWARRWHLRMSEPLTPAPGLLQRAPVAPGPVPSARELGIDIGPRDEQQQVDLVEARRVLSSFLTERGRGYRSAMSSPVTAWEGCSRLSPHLAWGTVSMRRVWQATQARRADLRAAGVRSGWLGSLASFGERLRWHCHFMQKLEDQPELETQCYVPQMEALRGEPNPDRLDAWCAGRTGYPMVDACMRALHAGGWVNFRMRAMLVSFASYDLWLDWRPTSRFLARQFVDYEPGIHYPQFQMQSGTTGINTLRIYHPTKQARDHDPDGVFLRRWLPELEGVPLEQLATPWQMSSDEQLRAGCVIGRDYPAPIVDHAQASRAAAAAVRAVRRTEGAREAAREVLDRHGSRRSPRRR